MATATQWANLPLADAPTYDENTDTLMRQSILGQLFLCEMRVGYADDPGFLEPVNEKMCFGTCVHYLVEQHMLTGELQSDLLMNMGDWVEKILVEEYDWSLDQVDDRVSFFSELGVAYRTWTQQIYPKLDEPIGVEEEMFLYLGAGNAGNIFMKGTPDLIFPTHLRDVKTAGRGWKQAKADVSIQASLYLPLVKQNYDGLEVKDFIFDVYDRSKSTWESLPVKRRVKDINSALKTAYAGGLKVEAGLFTAQPVPEASFTKKRGWYCSPKFCGAWNVCDFKFLADDVNENQVAIRSWN